MPLFARADLSVNFKERKVLIEVKERRLAGILCLNENKCYGFDKDGVLFKENLDAEGTLILKINDENERKIILGQSVLADQEFKNLMRAVGILKDKKFPLIEAQIKPNILREWVAIAPSDFKIYFSMDFVPDNFDIVYENMAKRIDFNDITYIDFRIPNRIYYK